MELLGTLTLNPIVNVLWKQSKDLKEVKQIPWRCLVGWYFCYTDSKILIIRTVSFLSCGWMKAQCSWWFSEKFKSFNCLGKLQKLLEWVFQYWGQQGVGGGDSTTNPSFKTYWWLNKLFQCSQLHPIVRLFCYMCMTFSKEWISQLIFPANIVYFCLWSTIFCVVSRLPAVSEPRTRI